MSLSLKIVIAILIVITIIFFAFFWDLGNFFERLGSPSPPLAPSENKIMEPPSSPEASLPLPAQEETLKQPPPPRDEKPNSSKTQPTTLPTTELPKCEYREFIIRIFSAEKAEPASLTVRIGDTVTFVNEDDELRWPGADPHPTHSSLPLFDALGGISKGQSYSHTFKQEGRYGWHDHISDNPPTVGFITVLQCAPQ